MATQSSDSLCTVLSLTSEELGCSYIMETSPSVAVSSACLEALQKNGNFPQVGI